VALRIALAEDSYIVREGIEQVLRGDGEIEVVASCEGMAALLEAVDAEPPDVVLTDIRMPPEGDDAGIQIASRLRETHPDVGVVVLSQYAEPGFVLRLLGDGSEGRAYLLKERVADRAELTRAIRAVAAGGSAIDPKIVEVLVTSQARAENSPLGEMTTRARRARRVGGGQEQRGDRRGPGADQKGGREAHQRDLPQTRSHLLAGRRPDLEAGEGGADLPGRGRVPQLGHHPLG
jgi:DNA-binding NarL/FixJ family response regulator